MTFKLNTLIPLLAVGALTIPSRGQGTSPITQQSMVGCWQSDSPQVSDGPTNCYRFFRDGKFIFEFSSYDETKRIISLQGNYSLKNGIITFIITSRVELIGGNVEWDPQSGSGWYLTKAKPVTVKQAKSSPEETYIELCSKPHAKSRCISIGGNRYYLMSINPKHKIGAN